MSIGLKVGGIKFQSSVLVRRARNKSCVDWSLKKMDRVSVADKMSATEWVGLIKIKLFAYF